MSKSKNQPKVLFNEFHSFLLENLYIFTLQIFLPIAVFQAPINL